MSKQSNIAPSDIRSNPRSGFLRRLNQPQGIEPQRISIRTIVIGRPYLTLCRSLHWGSEGETYHRRSSLYPSWISTNDWVALEYTAQAQRQWLKPYSKNDRIVTRFLMVRIYDPRSVNNVMYISSWTATQWPTIGSMIDILLYSFGYDIRKINSSAPRRIHSIGTT